MIFGGLTAKVCRVSFGGHEKVLKVLGGGLLHYLWDLSSPARD